ncbi:MULTISPECIES: deaminase [Pseudomonas]|uniref:deaminase n=1 Tax=Pseudomonas TaxID=286 RepID=UPI0016496556|nr:deaminase [Pseudomonas lurida]MBC3247700.1 dCMP deaminase [Pseudomonas lurida]
MKDEIIPSFHRQSEDREFMEQAIEEMQRCEGTPKVGAVVVKNGEILSVGHRRDRVHAERVAVEAATAKGLSLAGATIYTTLEPCVEVRSKKQPCSALLADLNVHSVVIGSYDPNPQINRKGWLALIEAGVTLRDFDPDLRKIIDDLNSGFVENFRRGVGPTGRHRFDYTLQDGEFEIFFSATDPRSIRTRWTLIGIKQINAYAWRGYKVAIARYASNFSQIDDATALDYQQQVIVPEGGIVSFLSDQGCVLVKVIEVQSGVKYGSSCTSVKLEFQVRADNVTPA